MPFGICRTVKDCTAAAGPFGLAEKATRDALLHGIGTGFGVVQRLAQTVVATVIGIADGRHRSGRGQGAEYHRRSLQQLAPGHASACHVITPDRNYSSARSCAAIIC